VSRSFDDVDFGAEFAGVGEIFVDGFLGFAGEIVLFDVCREELGVEALSRTGSAFEHGVGAAARVMQTRMRSCVPQLWWMP